MTTNFKTLLKTTAAVATLFAGSQSWAGDLSIASTGSNGALGNLHTPAGSAPSSMTGIILAPEKNAVIAQSAGVVSQTAGGIICQGSTLTLDVVATGNTIFNLVAIKDLDVYIRSATGGSVLAAFDITNVILGEKASRVRFWTSDITTLTVVSANVKKEARADRNSDAIPKIDLPATAPTVTLGGRVYTLVDHYSAN